MTWVLTCWWDSKKQEAVFATSVNNSKLYHTTANQSYVISVDWYVRQSFTNYAKVLFRCDVWRCGHSFGAKQKFDKYSRNLFSKPCHAPPIHSAWGNRCATSIGGPTFFQLDNPIEIGWKYKLIGKLLTLCQDLIVMGTGI